ncbi:hypothetical protein [Zoogloea sp.]|uniref:hypothetical protein n=1 Tax=Zoogloea sp. TaxID=49181 RepID=UPI0035B1B17F
MSAADSPKSDRTAPILDWLATDLTADADLELAALVRHLDDLGRPEISRNQFHRCLDLLHTRALAISKMHRERFANATLPLSVSLHRSASRLVAALGKVAAGYGEVLAEVQHRLVRTMRRNPEIISAKALEILGEQLTIAHLAGNSAPFEFWQRAHGFFQSSRAESSAEAKVGGVPEATLKAYKYLLAFIGSQPEGLTSTEVSWLADFLTGYSKYVTIRQSPPSDPGRGWLWIDLDQDAPPVSMNRRDPPAVEGLVYFTAEELARRTTALIEQLEGEGPEPANLPAGLSRSAMATLLRRLREYWASPPHREHARRRNQYAVSVCSGLESIWKMLREPSSIRQNRYASEWMVVNESPTGYAVMQVTGTANNLTPGIAIAIRRGDEEPWSLCIVRWIRTETPEQIELGLQVIGNTAKPVSVGFRNAEQTRPMRPALVLPPVAALGRQQAILAPAGTYSARRFMLVSDIQRLYIAQGRLLSLDIQTPAVELFQYEIDPYPM